MHPVSRRKEIRPIFLCSQYDLISLNILHIIAMAISEFNLNLLLAVFIYLFALLSILIRPTKYHTHGHNSRSYINHFIPFLSATQVVSHKLDFDKQKPQYSLVYYLLPELSWLTIINNLLDILNQNLLESSAWVFWTIRRKKNPHQFFDGGYCLFVINTFLFNMMALLSSHKNQLSQIQVLIWSSNIVVLYVFNFLCFITNKVDRYH